MIRNGIPVSTVPFQQLRNEFAGLDTTRGSTRSVVLRVGPSILRLSDAWICGSRAWLFNAEFSGGRPDAIPYELGVNTEGWYAVTQVTVPDPTTATEDERWMVVDLGTFTALPPHMVLSSYDIGHQVVVTVGEFLGQQGRIVGIIKGAYVHEGGAGHRPDAIAAVRTGSRVADRVLAPMKVRLPPGSRVWVRTEAGWLDGVVSQYLRQGAVEIWVPDARRAVRVQRNRLGVMAWTPESPPVVQNGMRVPSSKSPFYLPS